MNTDMTWRIKSTSTDHTERLAEKLGANLRGGEVIELVSDLGGGKTTFTRGLVRGTGSSDRVASPTFTISREYTAPDYTIAHFDFYRLGKAGVVGDELREIIHDPAYVVVLEWGEVVHDVLPSDRLTIHITALSDQERLLTFVSPPQLQYTLEGLA